MGNIGYCCIPMGCNIGKKKKDHIQVNRGMVKKTFDSKGLPYVSELVILNLKDTLRVLDWNIQNNIFVYRLSSDCKILRIGRFAINAVILLSVLIENSKLSVSNSTYLETTIRTSFLIFSILFAFIRLS